ncbi:serine/threonine protein kinase [Janibacter sp. CX7]|uniref:serine/threonine-protein kinase n=1 Tax=Janibacter sp. CX7 TaxID=2963431 RepID=UPI0020CCE34A|nr:serine/threonine-protein kinase [Janibacter sp. CX7]UTT66438.1 serine/threonine protein kinase [Janibacter sp. CX7]
MTTELIGDDPAPDERGHVSVADFDTIGPYRVLQQLGQGGMGIVHLALDARGRAVAVKVLRTHVAHDDDARARLAREVDTLARVRSQRIAPVFDADLEADQPYIVTRYVPGPSLEQHVREEGPLDAESLLRLARGLAEALRAIHEVGVIHRDLKPGNVLMLDGDPVVIDFGIAHVADTSRMTMTGLVMGTPGYLSPELVEGGDVTPATDWWGWAATLVFAATGRSPFGRGGMEAVLARVCRGDADLHEVDPELAPLLYAALTPDPQLRPDADEVLIALEAWARGRPVTDVLPQRTRALQADATRTLPPVAAAGAAGAAAGAAGAAAGRAPAPQRAEPPAPWGSGDWTDPRPAPAPDPTPAPVAQPDRGGWGMLPGQERAPWPGAGAPAAGALDRPGDPRIGKPRRSDVLAALLAAAVAMATAVPFVGLALAVLWSWLARTVDRSMTATVRRRHQAGRRRSDGVVAAMASPWHLVTAALATVVTSLLPVAVGAAGLLAAALAQSAVDGLGVRLSAPVPLAVGSLLALLVAWWGPGGPSLRRGSRSLVRGVTGPSALRVLVLGVLVVFAVGVLGALAAGALDVSWWPDVSSPLPGPEQLPGR